jgi:hypothetical protein
LNDSLIEKVKILEDEMNRTKSLFSRLYGNTMNDRVELLRIRVECGYDVNNDPILDENVRSILTRISSRSIDDTYVSDDDYDYLKELIYNRYCVTKSTIDSKRMGCLIEQKFDCKISPLMCYIMKSASGMASEKHFYFLRK